MKRNSGQSTREQAGRGGLEQWALLPALVVAAVGLVGSIVAWQLFRAMDDRVVASSFQLDAEERQHAIEVEIQDSLSSLVFISSLFGAHPGVRREDFRVFTRPILGRRRALQALEWNPRILAADRERFEANQRASGLADFQITQRETQGNMVRAEARDEYVVVTYLEPYEGNESALGFDVASERKRGEALTRARDTGELIVTEGIRLVQEPSAQQGFLAFLPRYRDGAKPETLERRRELIEGYVVGVFRIGDIVERALSGFDPVPINLRLYDEDAPAGEQTLYASKGGDDVTTLPKYSRGGQLLVEGRRWQLDLEATDEYLQTHRTNMPLGALASGLVITGLLCVYVAALRRRATRIAALVEERGRTEAALLESEERNRLTLESLTDGGWDWNLTTGEMQLSGILIREFGLPATLDSPRRFGEITHPDDLEAEGQALGAHLRGDTPTFEKEARLRKTSGEYRWYLRRGKVVLRDVDGNPLRMVGTTTDCTAKHQAEEEQRRFEQKVQHAQKLESLGVMAGGIAHDFNNLLTGILGNAELASGKLEMGKPATTELGRIRETSIRAAELVNQMLAYAGEGSLVTKPVELSKQFEEIADLLRSSTSRQAEIHYSFDPDLPAVEGDPSQLRQVLMNLLINASDALADEGGRIDVRVREVAIDSDSDETPFAHELKSGNYVCLEVSDDGCGMDAETCTRIFDPFFTTKFQGRGLGLAAVQGIVRRHGGEIRVTSKPGVGSTFTVLLPRSRRAVAPDSSPTKVAVGPRSRQGIVLVVDDEEDVRNVAQEVIRKAGFRVLSAADGAQAVDVFRENADEIGAVLLDLVMPRMGGRDAFREMQKLRPGTPIILTSGYGQETTLQDLVGVAGFLKKPYEAATLLSLLESVIQSRVKANG